MRVRLVLSASSLIPLLPEFSILIPSLRLFVQGIAKADRQTTLTPRNTTPPANGAKACRLRALVSGCRVRPHRGY